MSKKEAKEFLEELMSQPISPGADHQFFDSLNITQEQRRGLTYDQVFWIRLVHKALGGDMKAINEVLDRRYGKASQHIINENHDITYLNFLEEIKKVDAEDALEEIKKVDKKFSSNNLLKNSGLI